jgi:SAM-dependent methyltransferase
MLNKLYKMSKYKTLKIYNDEYAEKYYKTDRESVNKPLHRLCCSELKEITSRIVKSRVLDIGCGTGRYFHCINDCSLLIGMDLSKSMLDMAKTPINLDVKKLDKISLICDDFMDYKKFDDIFDLVYSIGVLGEHAPLTVEILNRIFDLLDQNGIFYFTVVDIKSAKYKRIRLILKYFFKVFPFLLNQHTLKFQSNYLNYSDLNRILLNSKFSKTNVEKIDSDSTTWKGAHFIVTCKKL